MHFFPRWSVHFFQSESIQRLILNCFLNGAYGVTCFFVVSGFLITQMLVESAPDIARIDLKVFYIKRAARIFPILLTMILAGVVLDQFNWSLIGASPRYQFWHVDGGFGWAFWAALLTFSFNWLLILKGNAHFGMHWALLWSLAIEEQFYFCYPWLMKWLKVRRKLIGFLVAVVLFCVLFRLGISLFFNANIYWMQQASFAAFDQIAIGCLLYFLCEKLKGWLILNPAMAFGLMVSGVGVCAYLYLATSVDNNLERIVTPTLMALGCALAILGGIHAPGLNSLPARVLSWPGKLSYGCYLWHPTIMFLLMPVLVSLGGLWGLIYLLLAVSFFAFFSYRYFEVPVNRRIRGWFKLKPSSSE